MNWLDKLRGKLGRPAGPAAIGENKQRQGPDREVGGTVLRADAKPGTTIAKPGLAAHGEDEPRQPPDREAGGTVVRERTPLAFPPNDPQAIHAAEAQVSTEWKIGDVILDLYEVKQIHEGGGMGLVRSSKGFGRYSTDLGRDSAKLNFPLLGTYG